MNNEDFKRVRGHPGPILEELWMEPLGLTCQQLAEALFVETELVEKIISGKQAIDADFALRLSRLFGTSAGIWLRLQQTHDLSKCYLESNEWKMVERMERPDEDLATELIAELQNH